MNGVPISSMPSKLINCQAKVHVTIMEAIIHSEIRLDNPTSHKTNRAGRKRKFIADISDIGEVERGSAIHTEQYEGDTSLLTLPPKYDLEDISTVPAKQAKLRREFYDRGKTEDEYKDLLLGCYGARAAGKLARLGAQGIISPGDNTTQIQDSTTCEKCRRLRLSCILGHLITLDDVEYFQTTSGSYNLAHVRRNFLHCRVCRFLRDCMRIEQSGGNPSKPKFIPLSASVFCGVRDKSGFVDAPCLVFSSKKQDRQGCVLPVSSCYRGGTIAGRKIDPKQVDYDVLSCWLSFCQGQHGVVCQPRDTGASHSLRCIDCSTRRIVRLSSANEEYLTLSYVWGPSPAASDDDGYSIPTPAPKVIDDAIIITQRLGFRFLWVDRYCIPQDDKNERDRQLKNMGHIYSRSVLTIIAAAGQGPDFGLPGVSSTPRRQQPSIRWGDDELVYCETKGIKHQVQASIWNTRGWTYQEGLLARRRLVFTETQVYFQCQAMHQVETVATQLGNVQSSKVFALGVDFGIVFPPFQELRRSQTSFMNRVSEFIIRRFTYDSDALDAFHGILALFADLPRPIHHLYGVPLFPSDAFVDPDKTTHIRILAAGLSWSFDSPMVRRPEFPSWTWVGWKYSPSESKSSDDHPSFRFIIPCSGMRGPSGDQGAFIRLDDIISDVAVESRSGKRNNWDVNLLQSLTQGSQAIDEPQYLLITGLAFEIPAVRLVTEETENPGWEFREPQGLRKDDSLFSGSDGDALGMNPSGPRLWAFIIGLEKYGSLAPIRNCSLGENCNHAIYLAEDDCKIKRNCHYKRDTRCTKLYLLNLLLKERDGEAIFERVGCVTYTIRGHLNNQDPENPQIGELSPVWKQMKIG